MRFHILRVLLTFLVIGMLLEPLARAGGEGVDGNWKVTIFQEDGTQVAFWLVVLENKGGKLSGTAESLNKVPVTTVTDAKVSGDLLQFSLKLAKGGQVFDFQGRLPKAGGKKVFGSLARGTLMIPAVLEKTQAKNNFELERDIVVRTPNDPRVFGAVLSLIAEGRERKVPAKDVQEWVDTALRTADTFGPRWQLEMAQQMVEALLRIPPSQGGADMNYAMVAADIARKAVSLMDAKAPLDARLQALTALGTALGQAGQQGQVKEVQARIDKLELQAYDEYEGKAQSFKITRFPGRKTKSNRAVLLELFTGAQCPPCVAADLAFDAMPRTYDAGEVVLLQYHLHVPGPDALTNADTEARANYYGDDKVRGTPTVLFNGKVSPVGGGGRDDAEDVYKDYRKIADQMLETPAGAQLQASATRKGDKIHIKAAVSDLAKPGEKVKLRLALVEDWARYKGRNGLSYYHQVVRALPGGAQGLTLSKKDAQQTAVVDLEELRKSLTKYLDSAAKEEPFLDSQRPMRLRNLSVVAFIQNDATQEVLQAVRAAVKEE
jgi:hypothetical protein